VVPARPQLRLANIENGVVLMEEVRHHELFEGRCAEVARAPRSRELLDELPLGPDPPDPHPAPHRLPDRSDGDGGTVGRQRQRGIPPVDGELGHGLVRDDHRALPFGERQHPLPQCGRHGLSGGIVEVGHEVPHRRAGALDGLLERRFIPAVIARHAHGNEPRTGEPEGFIGMRIAR
jgi:hypothetical protein